VVATDNRTTARTTWSLARTSSTDTGDLDCFALDGPPGAGDWIDLGQHGRVDLAQALEVSLTFGTIRRPNYHAVCSMRSGERQIIEGTPVLALQHELLARTVSFAPQTLQPLYR